MLTLVGAVLLVCLIPFLSFSDALELTNGEIIKGTIIKETSTLMMIRIPGYGTLHYDKEKIKKITYSDPSRQPTAQEAAPTEQGTPPAKDEVMQPAPGQQIAEQITPVATPPPQISPVPPTSTPATHEITSGYDAVLFGVVKDVKVRRSNGEWIEARDGTQLKANDEIITVEGKVKIKMRGRGEVRLPPNSHLVLRRVSPDGSEITIEIMGGTVWNNVTPGGGLVSYKIHTPDLTAGVRGTLFKVELSPDLGSRVAVFEGIVETLSNATRETIELEKLEAVRVDKEGVMSAPAAVDPKERDEWDFWDQWELEVHEIAVRFPIGGQVIDNMARLHANDMRRYEQIVDETRERTLTNREEQNLQSVADAFTQFYLDTGVIPTEEQGFSVLVQNPGITGWNGPYYDGEMPPKDRWNRPLRYVIQKSRYSDNVAGKVVSTGPDGIFSQGHPATDDLAVFIHFSQLKPNTRQTQP